MKNKYTYHIYKLYLFFPNNKTVITNICFFAIYIFLENTGTQTSDVKVTTACDVASWCLDSTCQSQLCECCLLLVGGAQLTSMMTTVWSLN